MDSQMPNLPPIFFIGDWEPYQNNLAPMFALRDLSVQIRSVAEALHSLPRPLPGVMLLDCNRTTVELTVVLKGLAEKDTRHDAVLFGCYTATGPAEQPAANVSELTSHYAIRRVFSIPFQKENLVNAVENKISEGQRVLKRILVIDDSPTALAMTIKSLSQFYNVITASTGQEGLRLSMLEEPDLILLDLNMPDTNGLKVCADLKSFYPTDQTPIIVYTASGDRTLIDKAMLVGATDYVLKNADDSALIKKIEQFLNSNYTGSNPYE